jgi:hypothetical protein
LALDELGFEVFQIVIVETELPFQSPIGHPAAAPEQVHDLVEQGIKVHRLLPMPMRRAEDGVGIGKTTRAQLYPRGVTKESRKSSEPVTLR